MPIAQKLTASIAGFDRGRAGEFVMDFVSADNPILGTAISTGARETHYALFVATWGSGKRKSWIVRLRVKQLHRVP